MDIQLIQLPYFLGHENERSGRGPDFLVHHGADRILRANGHTVTVERIETNDPFVSEIGQSFGLYRLLADAVRTARTVDRLPIVLAGNCGSCTGTISGTGSDDLGVIWFDSHGDFNTPETSESGFFDGMGLAMATGRGWSSLMKTLPGFQPVRDRNVLHIGARFLDSNEHALLAGANIRTIMIPETGLSAMPTAIESAVRELSRRVRRVYIHVDVDVLETGKAKANWLGAPGGLPAGDVVAGIKLANELFAVEACALASFDPSYDVDDIVLRAAFDIIEAFAN